MSKRIWSIALAYVGVMIGAGVSSGQDLLQYFVSFWSLGTDRCHGSRNLACWLWATHDCSGKLLPLR